MLHRSKSFQFFAMCKIAQYGGENFKELDIAGTSMVTAAE